MFSYIQFVYSRCSLGDVSIPKGTLCKAKYWKSLTEGKTELPKHHVIAMGIEVRYVKAISLHRTHYNVRLNFSCKQDKTNIN
jgi:hypothetical protein